MAAAKRNDQTPSTATRGPLVALAILGAAAAAWAGYLWRQLLAARSGGEATCSFGGDDCLAVWDGGFASWVHDASGLPVAAWGVAWGLAALLMPLAALVLVERARVFSAASRWIAIAGLAGMAVLIAVLATSGGFCGDCAIFYLLVAIYGALALWQLPRSAGARVEPWHGPAIAAAALLAAWLILLWPASTTPHADAEERALTAVGGGEGARREPGGQGASSPTLPPATSEEKDGLLRQFLTNLEPEMRQALADQLAMYAAAETHDPEPPDGLIGDEQAPVLVTTFSDTLCDHCARLHVALSQMEQILPGASFAIESRHFPLDGNCNPHLPVRGPETVRCLAARARICMEELGDEVEYAAGLYSMAPGLTERDVYTLAEPWTDEAAMRSCVTSAETTAELRRDIDYAQRYGIQGTPLLLVDGREAPASPPVVFALVLAEGDAQHPAFELLPPPDVAPAEATAAAAAPDAG